MAREPRLRVGLAGLGAVGLDVARRLEAGIPGLTLAEVAVRDADKACRDLPRIGNGIALESAEKLAENCDLVVECLPPVKLFRTLSLSPSSIMRQAVHAAVGRPASGTLGSGGAGKRNRRCAFWCRPAPLIRTRRGARRRRRHHPFGHHGDAETAGKGLEGAPYLVERGITLKGLNTARKVFDWRRCTRPRQRSRLSGQRQRRRRARRSRRHPGRTGPNLGNPGPTRRSTATPIASRSRPISRAFPCRSRASPRRIRAPAASCR